MDIPINKPWLPPFDEFAKLANNIFERRYVSNFSKYSQLLESRASNILGKAAVSVSSCDIGLTLTWKALGLNSGEVIVPSFTFPSTVNSLVWNGLTPVFADIDPYNMCLDPLSVEKLISSSTVGIIAVHCFGEPVSTQIDYIAKEHNLKLVFDAAHAIGTTVQGKSLAGRGDASVFSLSGTKVATAGEGGVAVFADSNHSLRFKELRGYGFINDYNAKSVGLNGKMSELNAALGYLSLDSLDKLINRRNEIATRYQKNLSQYPDLQLPPEAPIGDTRSYHSFIITFQHSNQRKNVENILEMNGVEFKRYFLPVHKMQAYTDCTINTALSITDDVWDRSLCIPMFYDLTNRQVDFISSLIEQALLN